MTGPVLITGITGFAGSHLAEYLLDKDADAEVHGTWRPHFKKSDVKGEEPPKPLPANLKNVRKIKDQIVLHKCNLLAADEVTRLIQEVKPCRVYHLAAQTSVPLAFAAPGETMHNNISSQLNLMMALKEYRNTEETDLRILIVGSSHEYGYVYPEEIPIKETNPLRPVNPYGLSKAAQSLMASEYAIGYGMDVMVARPFGFIGAGRADGFAETSFAKQVNQILLGKKEPVIRVGNLEAERDYTDVKDVVRGFYQIMEMGKRGEIYNLCSGIGRTVGDLLNAFIEESGVIAKVEVARHLLRKSDIPVHVGDNSRVFELSGWKPEIPFRETIKTLLEDWRIRVMEGEGE